MKVKFWPTSKAMKFSLIAFITCIALSILSMGYLGMGLYYIASLPLALVFPDVPKNMNTWHGDWVWPAMIIVPILWSLGFIVAGNIYLHLLDLNWTRLTLTFSYLVVLLLWNIAIWLLLLLNLSPLSP